MRVNNKKRLVISFSGGRTSAYMMWWLLYEWEERHDWQIIVIFANTGLESAGTLVFVHECSWRWGIPIVWVEAIPVQSPIRIIQKGRNTGKKTGGKWWGVIHKVVNYFTASRANSLIGGGFSETPFEQMISKLGIPSTNAPFCSDQLKKKAIKSYLKSIGWKKYHIAIGIRSDEIDRCKPDYKKLRIFYPLAFKNPKTKQWISDWFSRQPFDLKIHPDEGNCVNCWKKNLNLLCRNATRIPSSYDWWQYITDTYGNHNPRAVSLKPPFNFYRGNLSPIDIKTIAGKSESYIEQKAYNERLNGCEESCEAF